MTIRNTYAAEAWDKVYDAFSAINFTAYDYDTIKESLLQYLQIYHAENFNDFIESSELVAMLELFAYTAEQLAYRIDLMSHENFMTTAQRKQSILRLARLISYKASRNVPARGLVKLTSVKTSEQIFDSLGNDLTNVTVTWNDPNNSNWKEQFFLVMNKSLTSKFGQPQKSFQIGDVLMQLYTFNNNQSSFRNGVFSFSVGSTTDTLPAEVVPIDIDANGPFERSPDLNSQLNIVYAVDGRGDGSDYTGFLMFMKQGTLLRTDYTILEPTENRRLELDAINVNDTDVWVYRVDSSGNIIENWTAVETINEQNLIFNDVATRKKFEVETLENDRIALLFGDGNFSDAPVGDFQIWTRISVNSNVTIPKNQVVDQKFSFTYTTQTNVPQTLTATFSLTSALQNNSASEDIEHIRKSAPATYYAQNRMVNGQDYNTFMLKDQTILKLKTINRTFAGQPKYIEWNDASGAFQNVKLFGDDLLMYYDITANSVESTGSSRSLIDTYIEPLLQQTGVFNILTHISATHPSGYGIISNPRRKFIEDARPVYFDGITGAAVNPYGLIAPSLATGSLNEKTALQGALDRHWYGEPLSYVTIDGIRHGVISDPTTATSTSDGNLYDDGLKRTIDGVNTWPPGDIGSGLQTFLSNQQFFGVRFNRFLQAFGNGTITLSPVAVGLSNFTDRVEVFTVEVQSDKTTLSVVSNLRGRLSDGRIGSSFAATTGSSTPIEFTISQGTVAFDQGDAFIIELRYVGTAWVPTIRQFNGKRCVNLSGWFELIRPEDLTGIDPTDASTWARSAVDFDPVDPGKSWVFLVKRENDSLGNPLSFTVFYRDMRLLVESPTTKFWYNQSAQIIDSETLKPVYDKIRILRSNLDSNNRPLLSNDLYDVVGFVYDSDGTVVTNKLEVLPADNVNFARSGSGLPDNILQFENFSFSSYQFGRFDPATGAVSWLSCGTYRYVGFYDTDLYDTIGYDNGRLEILDANGAVIETFLFSAGNFFSVTNAGQSIFRRRIMPTPCSIAGLDFMWQHFTPQANLIDPSPTNIHDAFILTRGYHDDVQDFINGVTTVAPTPPTPLELRTSYSELLKSKMLSDTLVLHSGRMKLLFGSLADPQLRAKFRVVKNPSASFSNERIKAEIILVINTYFDITNWDFGDSFYATELISLIHQRLPTQIASVVMVPTYSVNSFGSLFTIDSGFDEILQSCATVNDVEIVDALTPSVLRQVR